MRVLPAAVALLLAVPAQSAPSPRLPLHPCNTKVGAALCGTLRVPENRAAPAGRTISLNVVVFRATGRPVARDPVFYLAGGPGGAASDNAGWLLTVLADVNRHRDLVLVDQRGTGGSGRIVCPPVPETVQDASGLKAFVAECQTKLGADFTQYGTAAAMDDVDAVRAALGYAKIDVYGGSYGVTAAQVYLNGHPDSVRSLILDSGTLLEVPIFERWGTNGQRSIDQIAARCAADARCARAYPHWASDLVPLIDRLDAKPVEVDDGGVRVTIDGSTVAGVVHDLSRSGAGAAVLPRAVAYAVRGDYSLILSQLQDEQDDRLMVMFQSIMCNEPWALWDVGRTLADVSGTYLASSYPGAARDQELVCSVFPRWQADPADWHNPRSDVPALVLVGGADPQDPIGNIAAIRRGMPRARLVVVPGEGHGVSLNPCVAGLIGRFLARGTANGLATGCVRRSTPPPFLVD